MKPTIATLGTFNTGAEAIAAARKMNDLADAMNLTGTEKHLLDHLVVVARPDKIRGYGFTFEVAVHTRPTRRSGTILWAAPGHPIYPDAAEKKEVV